MVTKEGVVLYKDPEGVALDGWLGVPEKNILGFEIVQSRFFRLVKHPTQLFYYSSETAANPKGKIELKDDKNEFVELRRNEAKLLVLARRTEANTLVCENHDEATMWELAIKACMLHEETANKKNEQDKIRRMQKILEEKRNAEKDGSKEEEKRSRPPKPGSPEAVQARMSQIFAPLDPAKDYASA
mmetsp:Transcript_34565/g.83621  ORF Transcript_34565/g.83621 Transcript_34565/m.83621 type:complete len:186 (-) Transcript_34565:272-829(-)|eukprot:CAMPEP_0114529420 /NCGR_PEP_ID=MMETSP0109-20121206/24825_1 /TAXON_ID=29199 /ORGANISM="Chlorarachnion reptans, Strain CCCM449" /LENGTH=185 /DNA_ID=CAMNT_0001711821 /DNA_START=45 /DNA_END=602 /DNA_ORIENTATION=+